MRVAIVHDFLSQRGGAERAVAAMTRIFPNAPLFTSFYDPDDTYDDFRGVDVRTTFMQKIPHSGGSFRKLLPIYPWAFKSMDLTGFDLIISSTTNFAHHVRAGRAHHVVYCYNPPRWLYQTEEYLGEAGPAPGWSRLPLAPVLSILRRMDKAAASRPDAYIGISKLVVERIRRIYGREAEVVYPPIDVDRFHGLAPRRKEGGDHFLVVSRLLPYKRVDLAVEVCSRLELPLVVVGDGPARSYLERIAGPTVKFAGKVDEPTLLDLFGRATALIHCAYEDFGLTPLEANAAGIPCVALRNGGALETVIDGETGILFPEQQGGKLEEALLLVRRQRWDPQALRRHAARFDEKAFEARLLAVIEESLGRSAK